MTYHRFTLQLQPATRRAWRRGGAGTATAAGGAAFPVVTFKKANGL